MTDSSLQKFLDKVIARNPSEPEYQQAVGNVMTSLWPYLERNSRYMQAGLLERIVEAERIVVFRVSWVDDKGRVHVNRGYRVQHSQALGPFKGGLRFHPSVNLSVLKFLAFEQTFKNALTGLLLGGGKGGADFDPRGRSEGEIMRFCQAFAMELHRHVGVDNDVPAGDIGVGAREVGFLSGYIRKITGHTGCVFTGKPAQLGGSKVRNEATGYGAVYFVNAMLEHAGKSLDGMKVAVSGSGNVAQSAIRKAMECGATVVSCSDSSGMVCLPEGFDEEKLALLMDVKNRQRARVSDFARCIGARYFDDRRPWSIPVDVALPCATQNELDEADARQLIDNGLLCLAEGANMPCTEEAVAAFRAADVLYAPGKASNAGGVTVSGLEMSQNAVGLSWSGEEVDRRLHAIMQDIHASCLEYGTGESGRVDYVCGANTAGFVRLAEAMQAQGVV